MKKILLIKMFRDLKQNFIQFLAIFIMCFFAAFVFSGIDSPTEGLRVSVDRYFTETNFMDIGIIADSFTQEDLSAVESLKNVEAVSMHADIVGRIITKDGTEKKAGMRFITNDKVSKMLLLEGDAYEPGMPGVWIDWHFARTEHYAVGDKMSLKYEGAFFDETVRGIVDNPDFYSYTVDDTYTEPRFGDYCYCFMDVTEYPGRNIVYDKMDVSLVNVSNQINITDADKREMEKAKVEIMDVLSKNNLTVLTKSDESGFSSVISDIDFNEMIDSVIPVLFIAVAILGVVTTMTRIMAKHRTLIGALKALGFSRRTIMLHYMSYVTVIAVLACISGSVIGYYTLGASFFHDNLVYHSNPYAKMLISQGQVIVNLAIVIIATLTAYMCCRKLLVQNAADILRPEPPAQAGAGPMEKLKLWNRLSFASRWNLRDVNLNRFRTITGIMGVMLCAALMVTAFAFNDTLKYEDVWRYDHLTPAAYNIIFKEGTGYGTVYDYSRRYKGQMVMISSVEIRSSSDQKLYTMTVVDKGNLFRLADKDLKIIDMPQDSASLTVKAADFMEVSVGDSIDFRIPGQKKWYTVRVGSVNKTDGAQGIVLTRALYEKVQGQFQPNNVYTNMKVPDSMVTDHNEISAVITHDAYIRSSNDTSQGVDDMVAIIMIIAVIVGVVVMYNLGVLSYMEKIREIATLKVLGFPSNHIRWILQQQNLMITGIGTLLGMPLGVPLLELIYEEEAHDIDYIIVVGIKPFIYAFLLCFVLSIIINTGISSQVKNIDMVEALKGVE